MTTGVWLGLGGSIATMGLHAVARMLTHRVALKTSSRKTFVAVELGGLGGRMGLVFAVMILVLLYAPVHVPTYVGTLVCLLIVSTVFEVWTIVRRMERDGLAA